MGTGTSWAPGLRDHVNFHPDPFQWFYIHKMKSSCGKEPVTLAASEINYEKELDRRKEI